jgi:hypothetical protein
MSTTPTTTEATTARPETYRLPKPRRPKRQGKKIVGWLPAEHDPFFGFSRAFHYVLDKRLQAEGKPKLLIHICGPGKTRGCTLVRYSVMEAFVREQIDAQNGQGAA